MRKPVLLLVTILVMSCGVFSTGINSSVVESSEAAITPEANPTNIMKLELNQKKKECLIKFAKSDASAGDLLVENYTGAFSDWRTNYCRTDYEKKYVVVVYRKYLRNADDIAKKTGYLNKDNHTFIVYNKFGKKQYEKHNSFYSPVAISSEGYLIIYQKGLLEDLRDINFEFDKAIYDNPPGSEIVVLNPKGNEIYRKSERFIFTYGHNISPNGEWILYLTELEKRQVMKAIQISNRTEKVFNRDLIPMGKLTITDKGELLLFKDIGVDKEGNRKQEEKYYSIEEFAVK